MARTRFAAVEPTVQPARPAAPIWREWPGRLQEFQVHTARDVLQLGNEYVAAMTVARDAQAIVQARQALALAWKACIESVGQRWAALAQGVPVDAWTAIGWRPKVRARAHAEALEGEAPVDLIEQARLGAELLLRPWVAAPGLAHTDEFVA